MKDLSPLELAKELFSNYLTRQKQRKTTERFTILEQIFAFEGHFRAEDIFQLMQKEYRVSLATVYNTLELLLDCCHLIVKHQFGSQTAEYERVFGNTVHYHRVCLNCGSVREFSDKNIKLAIQSKKFTNFEPSYYTLYFYGLCSKCSAKDNI